ncbi:MAG: hypothetical protein JO307_03210 [Bryobacterales bacterium]|nr:hypothetical protein [Bryobacterales bacterium]MBV9399325.1 hypothetical protein [Bryobacterales bacterium]
MNLKFTMWQVTVFHRVGARLAAVFICAMQWVAMIYYAAFGLIANNLLTAELTAWYGLSSVLTDDHLSAARRSGSRSKAGRCLNRTPAKDAFDMRLNSIATCNRTPSELPSNG